MNKKTNTFVINLWEIYTISTCISILVGTVSLDFICNCFSDHFPLLFSSIIGLCTGIISAITILYLQRVHRNNKLKDHYLNIQGEYIRTDIGQDNTPEDKLIEIRDQNNGLKISLKYIGENAFEYDMELWKNYNERANGILEFNENNKMIATGSYKYYESDRGKKDFGTLTAYWFKDDKKTLYVLYQHVYPRLIDINNPDSNRGWQVWEKLN